LFARWTGIWPGKAEAAALGYFTYWRGNKWPDPPGGRVRCDDSVPGSGPDLNRIYEEELHKIFFVKPPAPVVDRQQKSANLAEAMRRLNYLTQKHHIPPHIETFAMADVSTAHITFGDSERIGNIDAPFHVARLDPVHDAHDSPGDIFAVNLDLSPMEIADELARYGFSNAFQEIFNKLHTYKIPYVRFDRDAPEVGDWPAFDW
jgi:hypothetical protein